MKNLNSILDKIKKSEIAIYVVALMLVAAGYFNYTTNSETKETYVEDTTQLEEYANVGDAVLVSSNEFENVSIDDNTSNINTADSLIDTESASNNTQENILEETQEQVAQEENSQEIEAEESIESDEEGETENTETESDPISDYYATSKLERNQMYAEMISNYEAILNNTNVSEAQKSIATQEITNINNTKNAIMICENLILTKGFENCVIFVNEDSINVVVSIEEGLDTEGVSKIQNIISREMGSDIESIHITEK